MAHGGRCGLGFLRRRGRIGSGLTRLLTGLLTGLSWSVLGRAFGLELLGVEDSIATVTAFGEGLCVVFESIWRRFCSGVHDVEGASLLSQGELDVCALAMDGARLNVSGDAEALGENTVAHFSHFLDGDVIAFAFLNATDGQVGKARNDKHDGHTELQILVHFPPKKEQNSQSTASAAIPKSPLPRGYFGKGEQSRRGRLCELDAEQEGMDSREVPQRVGAGGTL